MQKILALTLLVGLAVPALAENSAPVPTAPNSASSNTVKIFSDDVFPKYDKQPEGGESYTSEQRSRWMKSCEHLQDNRQAYRDCFQSEKTSELNPGKKGQEVGTDKGSAPSTTRKGSSIPLMPDPYESESPGDSDSE